MRNSRKNSIIRGITVVLAVLLMATFMLAGCADKDAQAAADAANQAAKDAATKAENAQTDADKNADDIAKLPTEDSVKKAIKDAIAAYIAGTSGVEGSDLVTADEINDFLTSEGVADLLADYVKAEDSTAKHDEIVAKFADYLTASAIETDYVKKTLIGDLGDAETIAAAIDAVETELTTALNGCLADIKKVSDILGDRTDVDGDITNIEGDITDIEGDITDLAEAVAALQVLVGDKNVGNVASGLASDISDLNTKVDNYVSEFAATSAKVVEYVIDLDDKVAALNKDAYEDDDDYNTLVAAVKKAKLELMRAQTRDSADTIYNTIVNLIKTTPTIADTLAKYLDDFTNDDAAPIMVGTGAANLKECTDLVALAATNDVTETLTKYGDRDLVAETAAYDAFYNALVAAQTGSDAINDLIDAINDDFAKIIVIDTTDYAALKTAVANVKTAIDPWIAALDTAVTTAEAAKVENAEASALANRALFIPEEKSVYEAAADRVKKLDDDKAAADELVAKITAFNDKVFEKNTYALYTYAEDAVALVNEVKEWAKTAELPENYTVAQVSADCVTNYQTALDIEAYATLMASKYDEALNKKGLVDEAKAAAAAIIDNGVELKDRTVIETAYANILAWMVIEDSDVADVVDVENVKAMLETTDGQTKTNYELIFEAFAQMKEKVAESLVAKIDALAAKTLNVYSMGAEDGIRDLRNEIVEWLNTYEIVAPQDGTKVSAWIYSANPDKKDVVYADAAATEAGYDLITNIATFEDVINRYDAIAEDILIDANSKFGDIISGVLKNNDAFILYEYDAIKAAAAGYQAWKIAFKLDTIDLANIDFGETSKEIALDVVETYVAMVRLEIELDKTLAQAQADYEAIKAQITNAIDADVTVKASIIPTANNLAKEWMAKYIDETRGFTLSEKITGVLTADEVTKLNNKLDAYNNKVDEAVEAGTEIKNNFENNVLYDGNDIANILVAYNAWADKYGVIYDDYAGTALDAKLMFMQDVIDAINDRKAAYDTLKGDVDKAIADLNTLIADGETTADQYIAAIGAAQAAIDAYLGLNNGAFDTADDAAFDVADVKVIYTAEYKVALLETIAKVNDTVTDEAKKTDIINALNHAYTGSLVALEVSQDAYENQDTDEFGNALSTFKEELDSILLRYDQTLI